MHTKQTPLYDDSPPGPIYLRTETRRFQAVLVGTILAIAATSFVLGFIPLLEVGLWAELPLGVAALLPIALDLGAVVAALAALVRRARGQKAQFEVGLLSVLALASVAAQVTHAYEIAGEWSARSALIAALLGLAPLLTLASSHIALRALMPPRATKLIRKHAPAQAQKTTPRTTHPAENLSSEQRAVAPKPAPPSTADIPPRGMNEQDLEYAVRLIHEAGFSQRRAAELVGVSRSRVETRLKQQKAA